MTASNDVCIGCEMMCEKPHQFLLSFGIRRQPKYMRMVSLGCCTYAKRILLNTVCGESCTDCAKCTTKLIRISEASYNMLLHPLSSLLHLAICELRVLTCPKNHRSSQLSNHRHPSRDARVGIDYYNSSLAYLALCCRIAML